MPSQIRRYAAPIALGAIALAPQLQGRESDLQLSDLYQRFHSLHERQISFVHRVKNRGSMPLRQVEVAVAIPRSDQRQRIHSLEFTPKPSRTSVDGWEQETAYFVIDSIPPGGEAEVRLQVSVALRDLEWMLTDRDVGGEREIPDRVVGHYLRDGENYKLDEAALQRAAVRLRASDASFIERVRRIHDFVIDSVEYKRDDRWDPADSVLRDGTGSCSEYAYLMIALCRLNGVPARYSGGTWVEQDSLAPARSQDQRGEETSVDRVFHRWVEVYLPRIGWFPVDPTQDDAADKEGDPYRYFGRLPWFYLAMTHGDGDKFESGLLGWEYRSNTRWLERKGVASDSVLVERFAVWKMPAPEVSAAPPQVVGN